MPAASGSAKPWEHAKSGSGSGSDPLAARFVESLSYDTRLYDADLRGSLAHARMLNHVGLLTSHELAAIEQGLAEIRNEIESAPDGPHAVGTAGGWPGWQTELEDVHMCIEAALIAKIGDAGRKLHTGRSRNDQVALDLRLWFRDAAAQAAAAIDQCLAALHELSARHGQIILPAYTHLQRAQPIRLSAELLAWHTMLAADRDMLSYLSEQRGREASPLGSGAVAGSSLPLDRADAARQLGFDSVAPSSIEATASRDDALDYLYALARTAMHLSRWAEQWILYCSTEFSFLSLAGAYTTGSSMMPQKRNPDMLELIRGRCGGVYGHLVALLTICKGLPIAYNRDLQEDKRHVFAAHDTVLDCLHIAARMIASATFHEDRIAPTLDRGHLDATSLAEYLVTKGVPFRTAHQIVGSLVRLCDHTKRHALSQLSLDEFNAALRDHNIKAIRLTDDIYTALTAPNVVSRYQTQGHGASAIPATTHSPSQREGAGGWARSTSESPSTSASSSSPSNDLTVSPSHRLTVSSPSTQTAPNSPSAPPAPPASALFPDATLDARDQLLIESYSQVNRTLDDLPYTPDFDRLHALVQPRGSPTKRVVFHRLHNLRKAGKLPKVGRAASTPPKITDAEEDTLRSLVIDAAGSLGQRDQLPFTDGFDRLVESFNTHTGRNLDPHSVWRLIAKLAK